MAYGRPTGDGMAIEQNEQQYLIKRQPGEFQAYYHEDEISLIDLWIIMVRHRLMIAAILIVCVLAGLAIALTKPRIYSYSTSIEIARGVGEMIEKPGTVLAKLEQSYIDFVASEFKNNNSQNFPKVKITAKAPKESDIIVLESKGTEEMSDIHRQLHEAVINRLSQDHNRTIAVMKRALEADQLYAKNRLSELQDQAALLKIQEERLGETAKLLTSQIADMRNLITESRNNRRQAVKEVTGEVKAMTLLLIDNEIQQYQKRLSELEEQLAIGIANDRDKIRIAMADNLRVQDEQREKIQDTIAKISEIRQTQAMTPTMRSLEPVGTGRAMTVMISVILGLILGVMAVFTAEFLKKAKAQMQTVKM